MGVNSHNWIGVPRACLYIYTLFFLLYAMAICYLILLVLCKTNLFISCMSIDPLPSTSYIRKAQLSLSSGDPAEVTCRARRNSVKSIVPLLSVSKVLNACLLNCSALPLGNTWLYIEMKVSGVSWPEGQSFLNPACHSWYFDCEQYFFNNTYVLL